LFDLLNLIGRKAAGTNPTLKVNRFIPYGNDCFPECPLKAGTSPILALFGSSCLRREERMPLDTLLIRLSKTLDPTTRVLKPKREFNGRLLSCC
jgi:hypothetical protein